MVLSITENPLCTKHPILFESNVWDDTIQEWNKVSCVHTENVNQQLYLL